MKQLLLSLPAHHSRRLEASLQAGLLKPPYSATGIRSALGIQERSEEIVAALSELSQLGIEGPAAAAWIGSLREIAEEVPRPDVVWSGPTVPGLHARRTTEVYEELIASAERSLWISSFVYLGSLNAFEILAQRMDEVPKLDVTLLLNIQRHAHDTTATDALVDRFADRFWRRDWAGDRHPAVYYDRRSLDPEKESSILHAKAVVADEERLFVTSANLTLAGLERNYELGLLVRNQVLGLSVVKYFQELIRQRRLTTLPGRSS